MANTELVSEEEKLERMIINGFCQKIKAGQCLSWINGKH